MTYEFLYCFKPFASYKPLGRHAVFLCMHHMTQAGVRAVLLGINACNSGFLFRKKKKTSYSDCRIATSRDCNYQSSSTSMRLDKKKSPFFYVHSTHKVKRIKKFLCFVGVKKRWKCLAVQKMWYYFSLKRMFWGLPKLQTI